MINITCENCEYFDDEESFENECDFEIYINCDSEEKRCFTPKEELIRKDEREKIVTDLENEIQNFNEVRDSKTIDFIYSFIKELKEKIWEN